MPRKGHYCDYLTTTTRRRRWGSQLSLFARSGKPLSQGGLRHINVYEGARTDQWEGGWLAGAVPETSGAPGTTARGRVHFMPSANPGGAAVHWVHTSRQCNAGSGSLRSFSAWSLGKRRTNTFPSLQMLGGATMGPCVSKVHGTVAHGFGYALLSSTVWKRPRSEVTGKEGCSAVFSP
ncbi:hypothetical protein BCV69DRAFT_47642 [Microstroma glucosiphilum]|uniref:Uncharacterized protein n=1 Tax=Pseudomicrostroma glucosiphilum TaxID=1684307 RepID=A0A316U403_9BASI|nr:hypothetical protein BCV69DRAFT_47642 [Pseudomicrostroma glucosiphilum]PWN19201.1 hypothetical protein BCV69DRAFT_47642 [Pseudomicrostroma glucosiphilum]